MTNADSPHLEVADAEVCDFHVVAIGASAGGLEALEAFFRATPTNAGAAFVVVQHLSPDFKSHMEQLLARQTPMPIYRVENGMEVQPNSIYLIPPRKEMIVSKRKLLLTDREPSRTLSHPIDLFFRSVANDLGRLGVAVVLSGTGSDGSRGIRDIHEAGGLVLCQNEETAAFDGMPINAQETGLVDLVLPPDSMGPAIERYITGTLSPETLAEQELPSGELEGMEKVFDLLRSAYGIDFANYRATTIARRIRRRMAISQSSSLAEYIVRLADEQDELDLLYHDLLIGVTQFFRDPEVFEALSQEVLPELLAKKGPEEPIRGWISGCATGEEAYSLAITLDE
ncbi:MAG: chemotaxis protein CheB, partial [Planctomycetota bacterium]